MLAPQPAPAPGPTLILAFATTLPSSLLGPGSLEPGTPESLPLCSLVPWIDGVFGTQASVISAGEIYMHPAWTLSLPLPQPEPVLSISFSLLPPGPLTEHPSPRAELKSGQPIGGCLGLLQKPFSAEI